MSNKRIAISEQQLLKYFYSYPDTLKEEHDYFLSDDGKTVFNALLDLQETGSKFNKTELLKFCYDYDSSFKQEKLSFIDSVDIEKENLPVYLTDLKSKKIRYDIESIELSDINIEIGKKKPNMDLIEKRLNDIQLKLSQINGDDYADEEFILDAQGEIDKYKEILKERQKGRKYPSGDSYLDQVLYNNSLMPGEYSLFFAHSGSGKTTYVDNLMERRRLKNLPTLKIELEMSVEASLDSAMSNRLKVDRTDLTMNYGIPEDNELVEDKYEHYQWIIDRLEKQSRIVDRYDKFIRINCYSMNFAKLEKYIISTKKAIGLKPHDYMLVSIDLLTQMDEFNQNQRGKNKADNYEDSVNKLSALCKKHNIHVAGVVQPKRPNEKVKVSHPEDVEKLRVNTEDLKNSGALEERARVIFSVFRRLHFVRKYLPNDPALKYEDDIMDVTVLKQNNYKIGERLYYLFIPERSLVYKTEWNPELDMHRPEDDEDEE